MVDLKRLSTLYEAAEKEVILGAGARKQIAFQEEICQVFPRILELAAAADKMAVAIQALRDQVHDDGEYTEEMDLRLWQALRGYREARTKHE